MFEDIYKQTSSDNHSKVVFFSVDFKENRWEEIKKDPQELGSVIKLVVNHIISTDFISKSHRVVFTDFQLHDKFKKLIFNFELYDMSDEEHKKIYLDKEKYEEDMKCLNALKDVKPGDKNDEIIPTVDND